MSKPVCLVIGAGAGIGGVVEHRFARDGYHAVLCRRSNEQGDRGATLAAYTKMSAFSLRIDIAS